MKHVSKIAMAILVVAVLVTLGMNLQKNSRNSALLRYNLSDVPGPFEMQDLTVWDQATGLTWQRQDDGVARNHQDAASYCENLTLEGNSDWRLPQRRELLSIADFARAEPTINLETFPQTKSESYWTSTVAFDQQHYWLLNFKRGGADRKSAAEPSLVRCVSGKPLAEPILTQNGDNFIFDHTHGLSWQRQVDGEPKTQMEAQSYCSGLSLEGKTDWRLPTLKELETITDVAQANEPAISAGLFPDTLPAWFWSSTAFVGMEYIFYEVTFATGAFGPAAAGHQELVRCVRDLK